MSGTAASATAAAAPSPSPSPSPPLGRADAATASLGFPLPLRPAPTFYPTEAEFADPIANPPFCLNYDSFQFRSKVQRLDMLQKRGQGGQAVAPSSSGSASSSSAAATGGEAASASSADGGGVGGLTDDPASSPRKSPADGPSGLESPQTAGSPTVDAETGASARGKRASKPPPSFAAEQAAAALAQGKRKRESSTGATAAAAATPASTSGKRASALRRKRAKSGLSGSDPYSLTRCEICAGADHDSKILLCDECDQGFHIFCLSPPLAAIPATDWYCPSCQAEKMNAFGFDMGRTFTLRQFQAHADSFLQRWFTKEYENGRCHPPASFITFQAAREELRQAIMSEAAGSSGGGDGSTPSAMRDVPDASTQARIDDLIRTMTAAAMDGANAATSVPVKGLAPPPPSLDMRPQLPSDAQQALKMSFPFVHPRPADLCDSFWRIVESSREAVSVDYGSDLDTEALGSGFPKAGSSEPFGTHPFNVNNLALAKGGVFNWLDDSMLISGVTVPWLYVGMAFSTFCWHVEDHSMNSVNYVHTGASKQWYGVPSSSAGKFERKMRQALPNLFNLNPDLLFQLVTMLNPQHICHAAADGSAASEDDPEVYYLLQNAGEFVISYPRSYHAGFNHGFNIAESVNFASVEWLPFGAKCIERYRFFRRTPIFGHEELVWRMAEQVAQAFENMCNKQAGSKATKTARKFQLRDPKARKLFDQSTLSNSSASSATASSNPLHVLARQNQQASLATFEQIWYMAAWLLPALQELLARETQGRAALRLQGTLRGKIWSNDSTPVAMPTTTVGPGGKKTIGVAPAMAIGSQVSAPWLANPAFNRDVPTDPAQLVWYDGTVIGWTPPAAGSSTGGGLYSVRFHEDGLVDEHVLPQHIRSKAQANTAAMKSRGTNNEWLSYQACLDEDGESLPATKPTGSDPSLSNGISGEGGVAIVGMKKKAKKSAVDFAPESVNLTSCAICRHALYLSCVRCSCCPEKASCLLHAQELCACDGLSKAIYFRYTLWQMENMLSAMETLINSRAVHKTPKSKSTAASSTTTIVPVSSAGSSSRPTPRYNPLTDFYELSTSDANYSVSPDAPVLTVKGTDPDNAFRSYPLRHTQTMCVFSMGNDEEETGDGEDIPAAGADSINDGPSASSAVLDIHHPSTRLLSSILTESRRIMNESDDYVAAVGLRDEALADVAAANRAAAEAAGAVPRNIGQQLSASAQPNNRRSRSAHASLLRMAAASSGPALAAANAAARDQQLEAMRESQRVASEAWIAKYSPWVARQKEASKRCAEELAADAEAEEKAKAAATAARPATADAAAAAAVSSEQKSEAMQDVASPSATAAAAPSPPLKSDSAAVASLDVAALSEPSAANAAVRSYSFLTASELELALHEGEKYIAGDESMLAACDLYGVLLSWQSKAAQLSQQLCALQQLSKTLAVRSRKLGDVMERECAFAAMGRQGTGDLSVRPPTETGQLSLSEATQLERDAATSPVQLSCMCNHGAAAKVTGDAAVPVYLASASLPAPAQASLCHLADVRRWRGLASNVVRECTAIVNQPDLTPMAIAMLTERELILKYGCNVNASAAPFQLFFAEYSRLLVSVCACPIKLREKNKIYALCRALIENRTPAMQKPVAKPKPPPRPAAAWPVMSTAAAAAAYQKMFAEQYAAAAAAMNNQFVHFLAPGMQSLQSTVIVPTTSTIASFPATVAGNQTQRAAQPSANDQTVAAGTAASASSSSNAADSDVALTPASWLRSVAGLLSSLPVNPLLQSVFQYWLQARELFPSLSSVLSMSPTSLREPSVEALAALPPDCLASMGLTPSNLVNWLRRLNSLCWAGVWWLTQCRRLLAKAGASPVGTLTNCPTNHLVDSKQLDANPIPPLLAEWASAATTRGSTGGASTAAAASSSPSQSPRLPWCHDRLGHASADIARKAAPAGSVSEDTRCKYSMCCASALLSAPILQMIDIPEAQMLEYQKQQCAGWTVRVRDLLPAKAYRLAGVQPPTKAAQREAESLAAAAQDGDAFSSASFRQRCGAGSSPAFMVGVLWESSGLGFAPPESFFLAAHVQRCQEWQKQAAATSQSAHTVFAAFYSPEPDVHPPLADVQAQLRKVEAALKETESLNMWTEEAHCLFRLRHQGEAIVRRLRGDPQPMPLDEPEPFVPPAMAQPQQQAPMQVESQPDGSDAAAAGAAHSSASLPAATASVNPALAAALYAPPTTAALHAVSNRDRFPAARTIGEMLDRVNAGLHNPLVTKLSREEREVFLGFSNQTLFRYKTHLRHAEEAGIDLTEYKPVHYQAISELIDATPEKRQLILEEAIRTGGAHRRGMRNHNSELFPMPAEGAIAAARGGGGGGCAGAGAEDSDGEGGGGSTDDSDGDDEHAPRGAGRGRGRRGGATRAEYGSVERERVRRAFPTGLGEVTTAGQEPVEPVQLLNFPPPTAAQRADLNSVYTARGITGGRDNASSERRRLLQFVRDHGFFTPKGLLPFQGPNDGFGGLHITRKLKAIRMIQEAFHTDATWTRKFLASNHGNNRRMYLDKLRQALQSSGGGSSAAGAGASSSSAAASATPRYTPQQAKHEQSPSKQEAEDEEDDEGEESKMMEESEHDSDE